MVKTSNHTGEFDMPQQPTPAAQAARDAAESLIGAFAGHDRARYFAAFAPEATFIFHNVPRVLDSRADYEQLWAAWEGEGFHVRSCVSTDARIELLGDAVAVFTHNVTTELDGVDQAQRERETIVLQRQSDGRWLGVHEHLSPLPAD
jgi:ketosteroid isomerase-like protein